METINLKTEAKIKTKIKMMMMMLMMTMIYLQEQMKMTIMTGTTLENQTNHHVAADAEDVEEDLQAEVLLRSLRVRQGGEEELRQNHRPSTATSTRTLCASTSGRRRSKRTRCSRRTTSRRRSKESASTR